MRSFNINDEYDVKLREQMNPPQWMVDTLKYNPGYNSWGNHEDYMISTSQWGSPISIEDVPTFIKDWTLDCYNELVNFYFDIDRESANCEHCDQTGYNPATLQIDRAWYNSDGPRDWVYDTTRVNGGRYDSNSHQYNITQVELDALWEHNRLKHDFKTKPTVERVNEWSTVGMGHDSINKYICVKALAEHQSVYGTCEHCNGEGYIYTVPDCNLKLQLWILHPRKGCSRGVLIENVTQQDLPAVFNLLHTAAQRNADRFSKIPK